MTDALNRLRGNPAISVSVVNSPALGGGMELITATDYRVMRGLDEKLEMPLPFIQSVHARIGASPGWGGAARLVSIIGRQKALHVLGSSKKIHPSHALSIGLVDSLYEVQDNENSTEVGYQFLQPFLSQKYPDSVRAMKTIVQNIDLHGSSSNGKGVETEMSVFKQRWFGKDNRHALNLADNS